MIGVIHLLHARGDAFDSPHVFSAACDATKSAHGAFTTSRELVTCAACRRAIEDEITQRIEARHE